MLLKSQENKIRRLLRKQGYALQKKVINCDPYHSGSYRILDLDNQVIVAGEEFDLTMEDIVDFIEE